MGKVSRPDKTGVWVNGSWRGYTGKVSYWESHPYGKKGLKKGDGFYECIENSRDIANQAIEKMIASAREKE